MKRIVLILLLCALLLGGCVSVVLPSHANIIDEHNGNAKAMNAAIQLDAALPEYVKKWWAAEAVTWQCLSDWAHGRAPEPKPTTQPAE